MRKNKVKDICAAGGEVVVDDRGAGGRLLRRGGHLCAAGAVEVGAAEGPWGDGDGVAGKLRHGDGHDAPPKVSAGVAAVRGLSTPGQPVARSVDPGL